LRPGTLLMREWDGQLHRVMVLPLARDRVEVKHF
jgi:hypothetical protein